MSESSVRAQTGVGPLRVEELQEEHSTRWDAYVERHPAGSIFHTIAWKRAVDASFPYRAHYFFAERDAEIVGVLPLFYVDNPLAKSSFVSVPMGVYGGVCAEDEATASALVRRARELSSERNAAYVELRQTEPLRVDVPIQPSGSYATFKKPLPDDPDDNLASMPRKARAAARKAMRDFRLEAAVETDALERFFHLFALNKRHLGSPVYPMHFFRHLMRELPESDILVVRHEGRAVAAVMSFYYKNTVIPYYSGADPSAEHMQINNFMYLKLMEEGSRRGFATFDFGRSREGTGAYKFKKHQGFEPEPLHYAYVVDPSAEVPDLTPDNPKFSLAQTVWKRLPLFVVKRLGPYLIRYFP